MTGGRHRRQQASRAGLSAAAIATSGAFALVPMAFSTATANAADAPKPNPVPAPGITAEPATSTTTAPAPSTYTVRPGDTLSAIAVGRGMNWQSVWAANKTSVPNANLLHPGEQLQMPTSGAPASGVHIAPSGVTSPGTAMHVAPATTSVTSAHAEPASTGAHALRESTGAHAMKESTGKHSASKLSSSGQKKVTAAAHQAIDVTPTGASKQMKIWLTGYSYQDNTPAGSATVSHPILHKVAGGTGTYADPITVAVPGKGSGIWKAGARFYLPSVKRYVIVEDTGASPAPSGDAGHLDMWVDGQGGSKSASDKCMDQITTQSATAIYNPPSNLPVMPGSITKNGKCNVPT
jgi:LysM repeat protein